MAFVRLFLSVLVGLTLLVSPALAKDKPPTPYDKSRESFVFDGRQNYPYVLWGVTIDWELACLKGKADACTDAALAKPGVARHHESRQRRSTCGSFWSCWMTAANA